MNKQVTEYTEFKKIKQALASKRNLDCVCDEPIGKGAYGQVIKAKCRNEGKTYAIKILPLQEGVKAKYQKRELEALTTLKYTSKESKRNIIEYIKSWILQAGDVKPQLCIQMELCSVNLRTFVYDNEMGGPEIIKAQGSPRFYQQVFEQLLNGLVAIHAIGWVHRDIHPGNILVVNPNPKQISDVHIKIADFGLSRHIQMETTTTVVPKFEKVSCFSRHVCYRAPELVTDTYDFKVDVYSAGVVLYFLSRYLEDNKKWYMELTDLKKGKFEVKERLAHKDDEKLSKLIENLRQIDPNKRFSALEAKEYMFPTQLGPKYSTDTTISTPNSEKEAVSYIAKDNQQTLSLCRSEHFTLSALEAEIQERMHLKAERQILNEVYDDIDGHNIFTDEIKKDYAAIIRTDTAQDDSSIEAKQINSRDLSVASV